MARRRNNNEGTYKKRSDGRWEAVMSLPDGKRKSFYGRTQREVQERLRQAQKDVDAGLPVVNQRQLTSAYFDSWLFSMRYQVDASSLDRYETQVRCHIVPYLGHVPIAKITAQQVQAFYSSLLDKGLSSTTAHQIHVVLRQALNEAVKLGVLQRNVTDVVQPPRVQVREMRPLTEDEVKVFLASIVSERLYALYILALSTGLRRGELLALHWQDLDLERGTLQVRFGLQRVRGTFFLAEPKSKRSRRQIILARTAVQALQAHRIRQNDERLALGSNWDSGHDFVFPNTLGKQMYPMQVSKVEFPRLLKKAGLPRVRFHDLRHTAATLLLSRGVNVKVVSDMLGHTDIATTLRTYAHVIPHMNQAAADVMDVVMSGF